MNPPQTKRRRILRRCLVGLGVFLTLICFFYAEELWRGKRAWENCKHAWEAKGVDLNWSHYIPAAVPENENVFGVPEMQEWFVGHGATELSKKLNYPGPTGNGSFRTTMIGPDTAAAFLKWSDQLEPDFAIIRQALERPYARMGGDYRDPAAMPIPSFVAVRALAQTLGARARCHVLLGQPEQALPDLTFMRDICRRVLEENKPMTLVSAMINVVVTGIYTTNIADGIRLRAWREPQLAALEEQLKQINLLPPVKQALETEWVGLCQSIAAAPRPPPVLNFFLFPRGWIYQNMVAGFKLAPNVFASLDPASQIIFPDRAEAADQQAHALSAHRSPFTFLAGMIAPNCSHALQTTARNQTTVNQSLIACALERYRLARGEYPETLDILAPQFIDKIPHDVIGGQPPHYRRADDGTFILYSIGWNGRDNGGVRGKSNTEGDWVWPD